MTPKQQIAHGGRYPFDAKDAWWHSTESEAPTPARDWQQAAARGIISSLQGRAVIKHVLLVEGIDEETRVEIIAEIAAIIDEASKSL